VTDNFKDYTLLYTMCICH